MSQPAANGPADLLLRLSAAMEGHWAHTEGRSSRIASYCAMLAHEVVLTDQERADLALAARVHDIGMVGIPSEIPRKKGRLTPTEFATMRRHAEIGADILEGTPGLEGVARLVRHHHERYDGTGYPAGLRGAEIPLGSAIIGVAEALDAMTQARPYRRRSSIEAAVKLIRQGNATQFHPMVVDALPAVVANFEGGIRPPSDLRGKRVRRQVAG
ncbi:MAG: HD-GYP domain-containing protein [Candidatus Dormibacteria bacterium]